MSTDPTITRGLRPLLAVGALTALLLAGCGQEDGETPGGDPTDTTSAPAPTQTRTPEVPSATETPPVEPPEETEVTPIDPEGARELPIGPVPEWLADDPHVQDAVADLAQRLDIPESEVSLAGYALVTWRDGSIGCPQEGMMYTMALVPGSQLVLEAEGGYFSYHAADDHPFDYCADPVPPIYDETTR